MRHDPILRSSDGYRRPEAARRTLAGTPLVPSQDVSRYQARNMPPPTYDLDRAEAPVSFLTVLVLTLAAMVIRAGIVLIQRVGTWLT
jgi:hypothetical protein